ncbi:MAG: hypothetical protein NVS9B1_14220 [Candidatus Dormibacteraceae bacterium]
MKVNATGDPVDPEVRVIQTEISTWAPRRGPNWAELEERIGRRSARPFRVYAVAGFALAAILLAAFVAMSGLNLATFATPVVSHVAP